MAEGYAILSFRWPHQMRDALVRLAGERTAKTGQQQSVNSILIEIIQNGLGSETLPSLPTKTGKQDLVYFSLRLPVSLHEQLSKLAEDMSRNTGKRVSMNTIIMAWIQQGQAELKSS